LRYDEQYMTDAFAAILEPGEKALCPVYCNFRPTGFLKSTQYVQTGFVTFTDKGRLLTVRCTLTGDTSASFSLDNAESFSAKKTAILKQHVVDIVFAKSDSIKKTHLRMQIGPKASSDFPNQGKNADALVAMVNEHASYCQSEESLPES